MTIVSFLLTGFHALDGHPFSGRVPYENSIAGPCMRVRNYYGYLIIPCQTQKISAPTSHSAFVLLFFLRKIVLYIETTIGKIHLYIEITISKILLYIEITIGKILRIDSDV